MKNKTTYYRYNAASGKYERVFPGRGARFRTLMRQFMLGAAVGVAVITALYILLDFPKERLLREQNERLEDRLKELGDRADRAMAVMEDIAQRDNDFYRILLQADPLPKASRLAGLERERYFDSIATLSDSRLVRSVSDKIDRLDKMLYAQSKSFDFLRKQAGDMDHRVAHTPGIQPISSKYLRTVASGYGYRRDPVYGTSRFHEGMDFSAAIGTPVYATADGIVKSAGWESGYGNSIDIDHSYNYLTRYAHLSEINVKAGQTVHRGDLIGKVGNTGKSTGSHLHYEVRFKGQPQNPVNFYFMDLTPAEYDDMIRQAENAGHVMD